LNVHRYAYIIFLTTMLIDAVVEAIVIKYIKKKLAKVIAIIPFEDTRKEQNKQSVASNTSTFVLMKLVMNCKSFHDQKQRTKLWTSCKMTTDPFYRSLSCLITIFHRNVNNSRPLRIPYICLNHENSHSFVEHTNFKVSTATL